MKKGLLKLIALVLVTKEIIPLNEEYLLILSFIVFIYLFYKILINFFYDVFSEQTVFLNSEFKNIYFEQKITLKLLSKTLNKSVRFFEYHVIFNNNFISPKLANPNIFEISNKSHPFIKIIEFKKRMELPFNIDLAIFDLTSWLLLEETFFYQNRLLKNIDVLAENIIDL